VFGAYVVIDGISLLADASTGPTDRIACRASRAACWGVAGAIALIWPAITALALAIPVGAWAAVSGIAEITAAVRYRRQIRGGAVLGVLVGIPSVATGLAILVWPAIGVLTIAVIASFYALFAGMLLIALALRMRRLVAA
jgi:uncharacterized membrane protein HdeD (DUF308 family)